MGVYIRGMEMPDCGYVCLKVFANGEVQMTKVRRGALVITGIKDKVGTAVPVPPHGDLIDRREAIIDANERAYDFWLSDDEVNATIQFLKEQTTIIQASEEGKI